MRVLATYVTLFFVFLASWASDSSVTATRVSLTKDSQRVNLSMDLVLDSLTLHRNRQLFVTPYLHDSQGHSTALPTVLVNGRNMQYVYERSGLPARLKQEYSDLAQVVARRNGTPQRVAYVAAVPVEAWMKRGRCDLRLSVDTCGCGQELASGESAPVASVDFNPVANMHLAFVTPAVTELPVVAHEGKARVQFEVDSVTLHAEPYVCRNGQRLDNRQQLAVIDDSIRYALSDEHVEIASISICGYASPESPYTHNDYLATGRSRSLAEYLAQRHHLPQERCTFSAVPENWEEFRQMTVEAQDITEEQRTSLLTLIDRPVYGPADYDAKERELKTSPRLARLYRRLLLPVWFPMLRCTKFVIHTRLRPMSDEQLAEVIKTQPQLMSLNQMFRVARLYPEGSSEFMTTIHTALHYYPDDPVANANAAIAELRAGHYDQAEAYLEKAGAQPEAENARGVLATQRGNYEEALRHFEAAGTLPEAIKNKDLLR